MYHENSTIMAEWRSDNDFNTLQVYLIYCKLGEVPTDLKYGIYLKAFSLNKHLVTPTSTADITGH